MKREQREIKFRAWDKKSKTMDYEPSAQYTNGDLNGCIQCHSGWFDLMQFTGLQDENGEDIYEGDILQATGFVSCSCPNCKDGKHPDKSMGPVVFHGGAFGIMYGGEIYSIDDEEYQVIGNIYENPELLEK